jgi:tripartite-type tricarboxylate transporter receptor subunit TctC
MPILRHILRLACIVALFVAPFAHAQSPDWPQRPIRVLVVAAAGGLPDITARTVAGPLGKLLGQPVVVENRAGGAGNIASEAVVKSPADGYTLLATGANQAANQILIPNPGFDYEKDLTPVAMIGEANMVLIATPSLAANNIQELIALARSKPGEIAMAVSVYGSPNHVGAELLSAMAKIEFNFIIYKGIGATMPDLMAGNVHLGISSLPAAIGPVKAGRLKALAVTRTKRTSLLADVPTVDEQGLKGFDINSWVVLMAAGATPSAIVDRLNSEIRKVLQMPEVKTVLESQGMEAPPMSPREVGEYIRADVRKLTPVLKNPKLRQGS